jgi:putative MATE family efflux protein
MSYLEKKEMSTKKKMTLFAITWPIFIEVFMHMLMGNADTLMLSQYSDNAVAAVGVSNQILNIVIVILGFIAAGTGVLISQHVGAKQDKEASEVATVAISLNILFGFLLSSILLLFGPHFLRMMNLSDALMADAVGYIRIVGAFTFAQAMIMTVAAIIRSHGFSKDAMYVTMGMNILNIIGNYIFIFGPLGLPILGVQGVAISTAASRSIGLIIMIILLWRRVNFSFTLIQFIRLKKEHVSNMFKIGLPAAAEHLAYNSSQLFIMYFITLISVDSITTRIYALNVTMLLFLFAIAIGQGTQILVGYKVGANEQDSAYKLALRSLMLSILISLVMAIIFSIFSDLIFSIFTDNASIIALGGTLVTLSILLEPGRCFNLVLISALRGAGDVRFPVYIGIASMWGISVPLAYLLGIHYGFGLVGIWIAFIADEWIRGLCMLWRWRSRAWDKMSFVKKKERVPVA